MAFGLATIIWPWLFIGLWLGIVGFGLHLITQELSTISVQLLCHAFVMAWASPPFLDLISNDGFGISL
jgi:hypothetical protein